MISFNLENIALYLELLSDNLKTINKINEIDNELLQHYEYIALYLNDIGEYYSDRIKQQLYSILNDEKLSELFLSLSIIINNQDFLRKFKYNSFLGSRNVIFKLPYMLLNPENEDFVEIDDKKIFSAKITLIKLAKLLRHIADKEMAINFNDFDDLKSNYDFNLMDENKILSLLSLLKSELNGKKGVEQILIKIDSVEKEIRKKGNKRWGFIITSLFVLFGFVGDLKTLFPETFDRSYKIITVVINTLHHDPQVNQNLYRSTVDNEEKKDVNRYLQIEGVLHRGRR